MMFVNSPVEILGEQVHGAAGAGLQGEGQGGQQSHGGPQDSQRRSQESHRCAGQGSSGKCPETHQPQS